ncbi:MAG: hypothetical protein AAF267_01205 [Deinococcota bacterium]
MLVFVDTNILVAMYCFEPPQGKTTLASEIADEVEQGTVQLFICDTVARELHDVIQRD